MSFGKMWTTMLCMATLGLAGCAGQRPSGLGLSGGRLAPCPDSPNCVSSQAESQLHRMEPIPLEIPGAEAQALLLDLLAAEDRYTVVAVEDGYIYAEATSRLFGFVDDVEFAIDEADGVIHFRSASRLGHGDLGANRKRMEEISRKFQAQVAAQQVAA